MKLQYLCTYNRATGKSARFPYNLQRVGSTLRLLSFVLHTTAFNLSKRNLFFFSTCSLYQLFANNTAFLIRDPTNRPSHHLFPLPHAGPPNKPARLRKFTVVHNSIAIHQRTAATTHELDKLFYLFLVDSHHHIAHLRRTLHQLFELPTRASTWRLPLPQTSPLRQQFISTARWQLPISKIGQ